MKPTAARIAALSGEGALSVFARARELERQGRSIIHLELGEPDFHPSAPVVEALKVAITEGRDRYCAVQGLPALRDELARYLAHARPGRRRRSDRDRAWLQDRAVLRADGAGRARR